MLKVIAPDWRAHRCSECAMVAVSSYVLLQSIEIACWAHVRRGKGTQAASLHVAIAHEGKITAF